MPASSFAALEGGFSAMSVGGVAGGGIAGIGGIGGSPASTLKQHKSSASTHSVPHTHGAHSSISQSVTGRGTPAMKESTTSLSLATGTGSNQGQGTLAQQQQPYQEPQALAPASLDTTAAYISSIVARLVKILPSNSGTTLLTLEDNVLVRHCVSSLVALSQKQLPMVLKELIGALEALNKSATEVHEEQITVGRLQSRLLVLRILSACMMFHWRCCDEVSDGPSIPEGCPMGDAADPPLPLPRIDPTPLDDFLAKSVLSVMTVTLRQTVAREDRQMLLWSGLATAQSSSSSKQPKADVSHGARNGLPDRPEQTSTSSKNTFWWDESKDDEFDGVPIHALSLYNGYSLFVLGPDCSSPARGAFEVPSPLDPSLGGAERPQRFRPLEIIGASDRPEKGPTESIGSLTRAIYRYSSQIISYLSSSNFAVVQARIRNRLLYLSKTAEEVPDSSELRLIEGSNLTTARLSAVLTELHSSFHHLKRTVQLNVALVVRRMVWSFVHYHPAEFATIYANKRQVDGNPELFFDYAYSLAETHRKKQIFWPMMTALFILCPDVINRSAVNDGSGPAGSGRKGASSASAGKRMAFFETLKKAMKSGKLSEVATLCCVDICRAASFTPPGVDSGLRLFASEIEGELRDKLFDPQRPMINQQTKQVEISLIVESFIAFYRLDPRKTVASLVPICVSETSSMAFKIGFVRAVIRMVEEESPIFWNPRIESIYPVISAWTRRTFKTMLNKVLTDADSGGSVGGAGRATDRQRLLKGVASVATGRGVGKDSKGATDEVEDRLQLLRAILQLWKSDLQVASGDIAFSHSTQVSSLGCFDAKGKLIDHDDLLPAAMQNDSVMGWVYCVGRATYAPGCWELHEPALGVLSRVVPGAIQSASARIDPQHLTFTLHAQRALVSVGAQKRRKYTTMVYQSPDVRSQQHWLTIVRLSLELELTSVRAWARMSPEERQETPRPSYQEYCLERITLVQTYLLSILSADNEVSTMALSCTPIIIQLSIEGRKRGDAAIILGSDWREVMMALGDPALLTAGRVARQRRIRALLRKTTGPTLPVVITWDTMYKRWQALTVVVATNKVRSGSDAVEEALALQWLHYAGGLCAMSGGCISELSESDDTVEVSVDILDGNFTVPKLPATHAVGTFVKQMVEFLIHDSYWVREKVKDLLALDLDVRANGALLRQVHTVLGDFFDSKTGLPTPTPTYTMFVEHSIAVASAVLARQDEGSIWTGSVDIGSLMVLYVDYINALGNKEQAVRIKTSVCQLCVTLMAKKAFFAFPHELRIRNRLFQVLITWTSDDTSMAKLDRVQRDLDIACLQLTSVLLDALPLLLADDALMLDDRVEWAKSRQFALYLDYFTKVLHRTRHVELAPAPGGELAKAQGPQWISYSKGRDQATKETAPLREYAILSLTHLLASNIDSGLQHSLVLGYSEDPELRSCFIQIMTNVLNQGAAFDDLERSKRSQKETRLVELIGDSDLSLAMAICEGTRFLDPGSGMDKILLSIFDSQGGILRFLKKAIEVEIGKTNTEEMVFRSNSNRTHLISLFARTHGYEYLRSILTPLIADMADKPDGYSFEIEPDKLRPGESAAVNQAHLEEAAQKFIDTICDSAPQVPAVMRELSRHIRLTMDAKFPNSKYQGVGGFIFLRLIGPAIVAPENIDMKLNGPNHKKDLRRGLLLVSKILQTLASNNKASNQSSTQKNPFMTALNEFLQKNSWKVGSFLDGVSDARTDPDRLLAADQPLGYGIQPGGYGLDETEQRTLHKYIYENVDKIGAHLMSQSDTLSSSPTGVPQTDSTGGEQFQGVTSVPLHGTNRTTGRQVYDQLCSALADLGPPCSDPMVDIALMASNGLLGPETASNKGSGARGRFTPATQSQLLQNFLRRAGPRSTKDGEYREVFFAGPPSRAGRTVFYYNPNKIDLEHIDLEGLIAYMIKTLESFRGPEYDVVIDATGVRNSNLFSAPWVLYCGSLVTAETALKMRHVMFYNFNTVVGIWADGMLQVPLADWPPAWQAVMTAGPQLSQFTALSEFDPFIERRNLALPSETIAITTAVSEHRFNAVTMVWYYRNMVPVTFKIGGDHLQITSLKPFERGSLTGYVNDVFHLADIDDVRSVSTRGDDSTFFITCRGGEVSFIFNSRDRMFIVQALREARARTSRIRSTKSMERTLLPSDVPGRLLNIAMLNMTSEQSTLRLSAYNLLCALSTSFNFGASSARKRLVSTSCLALPANTIAFVADLSKEFAAAAPGVTLEFFTSFFEGYGSASLVQQTKSLCYMSPWLANLVMFLHTSREQQPECAKRIKEIFANLLSMTVREPAIFACMQRTVWTHLGKLDDLIPILLDVFTEAAIDSGIYTERFDCVIDTMVSFSSINLRGKLLARLRRTIVKTAHTPDVTTLHENPLWKEIVTLARMNMAIAFTSGRAEALLYLPDTLHVVLLLAGVGADATRYTVRGTAVNFLHSLCTEDPQDGGSHDAGKRSKDGANAGGSAEVIPNKAALERLLARLSSPECNELFGLPPDDEGISSQLASARTMRPPPDNEQIVKLAKLIYEIEELAAPSIDTVNSWRARVASLTTSKAFQYNPIIQSRAFLLLGCMARGEIDDDLLYQILVSLRGAVHEWANKGNSATVISIVICLSKVVKILPEHSRYIAQLFWLGTAVVQFGSVNLFSAGIELIFAAIQTIQERHLPEAMGTDLINFLMDSRSGSEYAACQIEDETGLNFDVSFSFSLAALIVKGLRHPSTKEKTNALLRCVLEASSIGPDGPSLSSRVHAEQLGVYLALLPSVNRAEAFGDVLALAGLPRDLCDEAVQSRKRGHVKDGSLMKYFDVFDNRTALLSFALVAALLRTADDDMERLTLFTFLAESGPCYPAILSIVYDQITPSLHVALANAQSPLVLEAVQTIAQTTIFEPVFAAQVAETVNRGGPGAFIEEAGFPMLLDCASFDPNALTKERRLIMATLATGLLGSFIEGSSSYQ
ncbi:hypothetical protein BCV69DRAFT_313979 [Microstroma glucosiphilum]|uniref:Ras-GAP domain-containing protein n=1 Tax=Pseudomicrostroma glucosiphilum TaxID=1684307 RepID=A0A316U8D2_9BASI|nr:hypothetical protein BCV69DRAFT_313979 [Pseudomicrostroma glucosiphilum]PWN19235.1 hypothetical protein BCV69DRAFT_313979 [Pseudomicrostroma glucosiphilum]